MKIAIVTNLYPPFTRGGAEVVITRIVTELLAQGHEVVVVTSRPYQGLRTLYPKIESTTNENIYRFSPINLYHQLRDRRFWAPIRLIWHIIDLINPLNGLYVAKILSTERPDIVWTHNLKGLGMTIPWFLRIFGFRHVHQVHDVQLSIASGLLYVGHEQGKFPINLGRIIYTAICRLLFGSPEIVISPSIFLKYFYEKRGFFKRSPVKVVPNPAPHLRTVDRHKRQDGPLRILFVGQLENHKGVIFLINALKHFGRPFELTVAGEGSLSSWVCENSRHDDRLNFVGFLAMSQLLKLYQMSDVLVVPSLCYENSPTVIYEALQIGVPVLAADIGGVAELIQTDVNGFLFRPGDENDLLEKLEIIDEKKDLLFSKADEIRATVSKFAVENYVADLIKLFESND